ESPGPTPVITNEVTRASPRFTRDRLSPGTKIGVPPLTVIGAVALGVMMNRSPCAGSLKFPPLKVALAAVIGTLTETTAGAVTPAAFRSTVAPRALTRSPAPVPRTSGPPVVSVTLLPAEPWTGAVVPGAAVMLPAARQSPATGDQPGAPKAKGAMSGAPE